MAGGAQGIEIPITINADGTVQGFDQLIAGIEKVKAASKSANEEIDKAVGPRPMGGDGAKGGPGGGGFFETRMGQLVQSVTSAGLTFVERSLPMMLDPTKSNVEKALQAAPLAGRLAASEAAGAAVGAAQTKLLGSGLEIPAELEKQIIQLAGVAAEEGIKRANMAIGAEIGAARGGLQQTLRPFFEVGITPDAKSMEHMAQSFARLGARMHAGERLIADVIDSAFKGSIDDSIMKTVNGANSADFHGAIDRVVGSLKQAGGGG